MKAGQSQIVRWVSKLVAKPAKAPKQSRLSGLRELDLQQLNQVSGGNGGTATPTKGW